MASNKAIRQIKLPTPTQFDVELRIGWQQNLAYAMLEIGSNNSFIHRIEKDTLAQLALVAWANGEPFDVTFSRISIMTQA